MLAGGKKSLAAGAVAVAAALTLAACGDSGSNQTTETSTPAAVSATASAEAAENHNPADVMFAQHMIPHHSQAIEMSDIVLAKQDIDPPRVAEVAQQIKAAQGPEIEQLQSWLAAWGATRYASAQWHADDEPGDADVLTRDGNAPPERHADAIRHHARRCDGRDERDDVRRGHGRAAQRPRASTLLVCS